jgi:hypothetical protein
MAAINSVTELTQDGDIAIITLNSPPVNALSANVRDGLLRRLQGRHRRRLGQGDRPDLRRPHLHRRRRHQ